MTPNLGYCCLTAELRERKPTVFTNRTCVKKTFVEKGLPYVSQLAVANLRDLLVILRWNEEHDIRLFRLSSEIFPWFSEYKLQDLPDFEQIHQLLLQAAEYATEHGHRLTDLPSGTVHGVGHTT